MPAGAEGAVALDMSKFFDTNYHYMVPELDSSSQPKADFKLLLDKVDKTKCQQGRHDEGGRLGALCLLLCNPTASASAGSSQVLSAWIPVKAIMGTEASWLLCKQSGLAPGSLPSSWESSSIGRAAAHLVPAG